MQFDLVETILVREMKLEDRRRYVAGRLYRDFLTGINIATSEGLGQEEATESQALHPLEAHSETGQVQVSPSASLNDTQSL
jgi:hypothetical protein